MLECLILGDSIAVGIGYHRPECKITARSGINSWQFNRLYPQRVYAGTVVISLGSNDYRGVDTRKELEIIRTKITAKDRVYWILPAIKPEVQQIVKELALANGDTVITITTLQSDKIHPNWSGYKSLATQTKL